MCQHIDVGVLGRRPVGAGGDRLDDGLAVHHDDLRAEAAGVVRDLRDERRRHMGDLHAREDADVVVFVQLRGLDEVGHHPFDIGHVDVVGDGQEVMSQHRCPPHELRRDELPVAEDGVRMQVRPGLHECLSVSSL